MNKSENDLLFGGLGHPWGDMSLAHARRLRLGNHDPGVIQS